MIEKARKILSKSELDQYGLLTGSWQKQALDIRVSPNMLGRALRIFDAIVKFFSRQDVPDRCQWCPAQQGYTPI